jgi:nucleoside-triphosphatase
MHSKPVKILLTGLPGCGKTTAVMKVVANLDRHKLAGFYTEEIRKGGVRSGFRWMRLDGESGILAHIDIKSSAKVGKYGVDIAGFEKNVAPVLDPDLTGVQLFVIDEIGKMECFSEKFVDAVRRLFHSNRSVLATVAQKGSGLISEVKNYPQTIAEILRILSSPE